MKQTIIKVTGLTASETNKLIMLIQEYGVQCEASVTWTYDTDTETTLCAVHKAEKE